MNNISPISTHLVVFALGVAFAAIVFRGGESPQAKEYAKIAIALSQCEKFRVAAGKLLTSEQNEEAVDDALTMDDADIPHARYLNLRVDADICTFVHLSDSPPAPCPTPATPFTLAKSLKTSGWCAATPWSYSTDGTSKRSGA